MSDTRSKPKQPPKNLKQFMLTVALFLLLVGPEKNPHQTNGKTTKEFKARFK